MLLDLLDTQTVLIATIVLLLLLWLLGKRRSSLNLPPGPQGLPLLGSILELGQPSKMQDNVRKLRKTYNSDVVYMKLGSEDTVFLYDLELLRQAFSSDEFEARPNIFFINIVDSMGIISSSGPRWKQGRRYVLSVLRDFGMGKNRIEEIIQDEVFYLRKEIENKEAKPFFPDMLLNISVSNIVSSVNFGDRFDYDDEKFRWLVGMLHENLQLLGRSQVLNYVPWCRHLPGDIFGFHRIMKNVASFMTYIQQRLDEHKESFDECNIRDVIDALILQQKSEQNGGENIYEDKNILYIVSDLFIAGTETTTTTLRWLLLTMILKPEVQLKVQDEIDKIVPRGRNPTMADKPKLPYTMAVISEVMRLYPIVPLGVPHSNPEQSKIGNFDIPTNSIIMYSAKHIFRNPDFWPSPEKFDPEANFLDEDGSYLNRDHFIPFSIGKRVCLGEGMARMEIFLFFTSLLQKFTFEVDPTKPLPDFTAKVSFVSTPREFNIVAKLRENDR